jgi:hypothetical protein
MRDVYESGLETALRTEPENIADFELPIAD